MSELVEILSGLPDEALVALFRLRPDLVTPAPNDTVALAARIQSTVSVARALDELDQFTLEILDGLRLGVQVDHPDAVDRLRARFLLYNDKLVAAIDEVSSPFPAGLGRPGAQLGPDVAELMDDPAKLRRTLISAAPPARAVLDRLASGTPIGMISTLNEPVSWLLENRLLARISDEAVELPRELGMLLRRDKGPLGELHPSPPPVTSEPREQSAVDSAGTGQVMNAVRQTRDLLEALAADPPAVLRGGGMGMLPLRRLAKATGLSEQDTAVYLETAYAAGLLGELETSTESTFVPTSSYDQWRGAPLAQRWVRLANAWLAMTRVPALAGQRDDRDRAMTVLSPHLERTTAPAVRRMVLAVLASLDRNAPTADELMEVIRWHKPRKVRGREAAYRDAIREAAVLGLTGANALTTYGQALLAAFNKAAADDPLGKRAEAELPPEQTPAVVALDELLPKPVAHVLVQADLTVVVPGPAEPSLAAELELVADHESGGAASVYRVTPTSVRRALDSGYQAHDLHELFQRRSKTDVPQGLSYLIDDVARTHGGLRTGGAGAYVRGDDESLISTVLADRSLSELQLRRLAPTVLVTPYTAARLLSLLREAGYAPVPEDATGATVLARPRVRRAAPRPAAAPHRDHPMPVAHLLGIVEELRFGDSLSHKARRAPAEVRAAAGHPMSSLTAVQAHTQALSILQQAVRDKVKVWVGYVDAHGAAASRLVRPVSIGAGYLRAEDDRTQMLHTFALHRITAAVPAD